MSLKYRYLAIAVTIFLLNVSGCSLDVSNPNSPTTGDVLSSPTGLKDFTIGMQGFFSADVYNDIVLNTGVTTREMAINSTFSSLIELEHGGTALPPNNSRINGIWNGLTRVISMNDQILKKAPEVIGNKADLSGIIATSSIYKAMALGYAVQCFEQSPIQSGENVQFKSRGKVLAKALSLLSNALQQINATPPSDDFKNNVLLSGFDIRNTLYALQARYNLFAGNYQAAIDAANKVDMSAKSVFSFDGSTHRNPIFDAVASGDEGHEYAPRDNFGSPMFESGDKRFDFYLSRADTTSTPNGYSIDNLTGFYRTAGAPIPVYLPGEMTLIKAEAFTQTNQLAKAKQNIDNIRTKTASEDPFGVGADLPPYNGSLNKKDLLNEIFFQRSAELYLSGMRFEDARRLNRTKPSDDPPLTAPRNRVYYPYPKQERQNNPNTPPNPAI